MITHSAVRAAGFPAGSRSARRPAARLFCGFPSPAGSAAKRLRRIPGASAQPQPEQPYAQAQQQQPYAQPTYAQPVYPPAPLVKLSGGMKFAWFVIGALVGIPGILLAWVCNADKYPQVKNDAVKFSAIGFAVWMLAGIIFTMMIGGMLAAFVAACDPGFYGTYGGTW